MRLLGRNRTNLTHRSSRHSRIHWRASPSTAVRGLHYRCRGLKRSPVRRSHYATLWKINWDLTVRFIYGALPQTPLKELLQKFLKNLQKLFKIKGFSYLIIHFSPTARAQSVRDQTVLITSSAHSPKSITLNRRSLLALPLSRAQTLACAAFSLRDMTEDKLGFNGETNNNAR